MLRLQRLLYYIRFVFLQTIRNWFRRFRVKDFNLKELVGWHGCQPSTTRTNVIEILVDDNPWYTVREATRTTVRNYLVKLG